MPPRRKRYLDNTAPADNTANVVRPVNRMIQVKQQDTPARRNKETREYQANVERGQRIMNSFARTPAGRRAANRDYAIQSQKAKQEAAKEEAATVVGSLFKPLMPSTYVDMAAAIKNGQVNNLTDALATPYLSDSWSMRNPGKALLFDIFTPIAGADISKSYKAMKLGLKNPILGITPNKAIEYTRKNSDWLPARSAPIVDLFRLQIPTWGNGSLGFGHKYRAIGRNKGLKDIMENGIRSKNNAYNSVDEVYWAQDAPLREYTKNSPLLVRYDKDGPAIFRKGNFDNPTSSANNPISFYDDNITLHGRYPFYSGYHEIPKTEEGIRHAMLLNNLNRFVEQPVRMGAKGYLAYKLYDWLNKK